MKLKKMKEVQDELEWPIDSNKLPIVTWESFQQESKTRTLILVSGFIHDVTSFSEHHPGGKSLLINATGKDMTSSFFGGVYSHSNAAQNLLAMKRVGILHGGVQLLGEDHHDPSPSQQLYIAEASKEGSRHVN